VWGGVAFPFDRFHLLLAARVVISSMRLGAELNVRRSRESGWKRKAARCGGARPPPTDAYIRQEASGCGSDLDVSGAAVSSDTAAVRPLAGYGFGTVPCRGRKRAALCFYHCFSGGLSAAAALQPLLSPPPPPLAPSHSILKRGRTTPLIAPTLSFMHPYRFFATAALCVVLISQNLH
jgi:hypothetical protein